MAGPFRVIEGGGQPDLDADAVEQAERIAAALVASVKMKLEALGVGK